MEREITITFTVREARALIDMLDDAIDWDPEDTELVLLHARVSAHVQMRAPGGAVPSSPPGAAD